MKSALFPVGRRAFFFSKRIFGKKRFASGKGRGAAKRAWEGSGDTRRGKKDRGEKSERKQRFKREKRRKREKIGGNKNGAGACESDPLF